MIFFEVFKKKLKVIKLQNFEDINPVIGIFEGTLWGLRVLPLNRTALNLAVFQI